MPGTPDTAATAQSADAIQPKVSVVEDTLARMERLLAKIEETYPLLNTRFQDTVKALNTDTLQKKNALQGHRDVAVNCCTKNDKNCAAFNAAAKKNGITALDYAFITIFDASVLEEAHASIVKAENDFAAVVEENDTLMSERIAKIKGIPSGPKTHP